VRAERFQLSGNTAASPQTICTRRWPNGSAIATMSRSHLDPNTEALLARIAPSQRRPSGSAVKFCQIAEGSVDVYPRLATTCEWDVAAGDALLTAAGGVVTTPDGGAIAYGNERENFRVPAFIAWGDRQKARATG
jgi:3'(2'), 5'-bisphosphate nucleotidase